MKNDFECNIQEYIAVQDGGVICSFNVHYNMKNYECLLWYNPELIFIQIPEELEEKTGNIYDLKEYDEKIKPYLNDNLEDFEKVVTQLNS